MGEGLADQLKLLRLPLEVTGPGEPGPGVPLLLNEKLDHGAGLLLNTWKQTTGRMSTAFRLGAALLPGLAPRRLHYQPRLISPMSPTPRALPGEQNGSVSARRVAGRSKSVVRMRAGLFGLEATRVWAGKENVA